MENSIKSDHYILYNDTLNSLKFCFLNVRYLHIYMNTSMFQIKRATSFRVVPWCSNFHTHTFSKCPTVECLSPSINASETTNKSGYLLYLHAKPTIKILVNLTGILHIHISKQILTYSILVWIVQCPFYNPFLIILINHIHFRFYNVKTSLCFLMCCDVTIFGQFGF